MKLPTAIIKVCLAFAISAPVIAGPIHVACVTENGTSFRYIFDLERKLVENDPSDRTYPCKLGSVTATVIAFSCEFTINTEPKGLLHSNYKLDRTTGVLEEQESRTGADASGTQIKPTFHRFISKCQKDEAKL